MEKTLDKYLTSTELIYAKAAEYTLLYGMKILMAILIFIVGFWVANKLTKIVEVFFLGKSVDTTISVYLSRIFNALLKIVVLITAAGILGVETTSFIALLGAAGLAVGLALQGSLANFAGGVLILLLRPFRVGDYIHAQGEEGVVSAIDIFYTTLTKYDNRRIIIPNGPLIGGVIMNVSYEQTRRIDMKVGIAYNSDFKKVEKVLFKIATDHSLVLKDPPPQFKVERFGDSSIDITFQVWTLTPNYWPVYYDMYRQTKEAFDAAGIEIPFPQRELRVTHSQLNPPTKI